MTLGPPKRPVPRNTGENWVPVEGKPHHWRDANSHPDPAYQRRKYTPPIPVLEWSYDIHWLPPGLI